MERRTPNVSIIICITDILIIIIVAGVASTTGIARTVCTVWLPQTPHGEMRGSQLARAQ